MQTDGARESRLSKALEELRRKSIRHWLTAALVLTVCFLAGPQIDQYLGLKSMEYWTFQELSQLFRGRLKPERVTIVTIGDKDYWLGTPVGRTPTNRLYLAGCLRSMGRSRASVLALDVDLRSPDPSTPLIQPAYSDETAALMSEIVRQAAHHKIVLAKTIWTDEGTGKYIIDAGSWPRLVRNGIRVRVYRDSAQ